MKDINQDIFKMVVREHNVLRSEVQHTMSISSLLSRTLSTPGETYWPYLHVKNTIQKNLNQ